LQPLKFGKKKRSKTPSLDLSREKIIESIDADKQLNFWINKEN